MKQSQKMNPAAAATGQGAQIVGSGKKKPTGPGPQVMAASTLEGDDVVNVAGEKLGTIDEIMLDVPGGRIAYAVLSTGGFLGLGDKLFAIPWRALVLDTDNHCFVLDVSKERLEKAPGFDKDNWPSMADETWATNVHSYYGTAPYWE
jgi:sporulation protein YlmC with PRC-barrel domain